MLNADLRAYLLAQAAIATIVGTSVHVRAVPQEIAPPYLWLARAGADLERTLDQAQGAEPFETRYDVEAISDDPQELETLAQAVRALDCAKGVCGSGTMQLLLVEDHTDDYVPKGVFSDEGLDVASFAITVYGYEPGS